MQSSSSQPESDAQGVAPSRSAGSARQDTDAARSGREARDGRETREVRDSLMRDSLLVAHVEGMHSHRCEDAIIRAVTALTGVREVEVDFASGQASVIFDARRVSTHQVIAAIEQAGYRCPESGGPETEAGN